MFPTIVAFCGFYVAGSGQQLTNDATQVVLMRMGTRTVLSMQNDYKGPPDAFAMVVPVPTVLHEGDVKTLTKDVFAHVEAMGAPRLVEYWEQDPCAPPRLEEGQMGKAMPTGGAAVDVGSIDLGVKVEAKFTVGEYQIVILSAKDSTGLETWLRDEHYNIPAGAEPGARGRPRVHAGAADRGRSRVGPERWSARAGRAGVAGQHVPGPLRDPSRVDGPDPVRAPRARCVGRPATRARAAGDAARGQARARPGVRAARRGQAGGRAGA